MIYNQGYQSNILSIGLDCRLGLDWISNPVLEAESIDSEKINEKLYANNQL